MKDFVDDIENDYSRSDFNQDVSTSGTAIDCPDCGTELATTDTLINKMISETTWGAAATVCGGVLGGPAGSAIGVLTGLCLSWNNLTMEDISGWTNLEVNEKKQMLQCPNCNRDFPRVSKDEIVDPEQVKDKTKEIVN